MHASGVRALYQSGFRRVLRALLEAPKLGAAGATGGAGAQIAWLEKVINTPILQLPS